MTDFRQQRNARYVSTFKGTTFATEAEVRRHWEWCRHKVLPLLRHVDRGAVILELGCGPGYLLELLSREGYRSASGIDVSAEQVRLATSRGLKAEEADVFSCLEARRGAYDAILAFDLVEHFTKDELLA